ncbi:U7 snRNA-associated Sm-like protein LSm10 [Musca vetustissima]|uniref:U7 snRNA-associated Sm-like protein LSm10 n=1 Tax=Musca vetustissima TaxID=27455 RepID=UPI002AB678BC|nr:U7 snRNA-associated Sm-like protein LSm10 [Musca vetustissima]
MQQFSRKENFLIANTLNCVPFLLQGHSILIDLRNECSVAGCIDNADGHMNIHLTNAVFINRMGQQVTFDQFMVHERMIRQIHLPPDVDMSSDIRMWCDKGCLKRPLRSNAGGKGQKRTFKQKRAQERHKEILQELEKKRTEEK